MTDLDLENLYKSALPESHAAGLRAVFASGYGVGAAMVVTQDVSLTVADATAVADDQVTITTA